jgi:dienelactone hydrolase
MKRAALALGVFLLVHAAAGGAENDLTRVLKPGELPADYRLGKPKTLDDYFPFTPPTTTEAWANRRREVRERLLVSTGLWPMPEKTPAHAVIHGRIERDGYTVEKVSFASYPGHYVSGNLYRPTNGTGKHPGVLCPHGHWQNGRFYDAQAAYNEAYVRKQIDSGAEKTVEGARFPLQARCAQLARMGCVVFHYDMVGVADSQQIAHRAGFTDTAAELRLQSFMGLQTYNSIRALDFLCGLPDVDAKRIGVTGASGGGTQTFILCGVDDRPAVAFPAVMVSTAMQGGCICENCSGLRVGTGNIEIAGLFAPKPLGMSGANDWTKEIETKGLPQLKQLYKLYGAEARVMAKAFLQFDHNYNQVSREMMYNWFNKHLNLGQPEPVVEKPFVPVEPKELSVYDEQHPRPGDATNSEALRKYMTEASDKQIAALLPKNAEGMKEFRRVVGTALRVMVDGGLPATDEVEVNRVGPKEEQNGVHYQKLLLGRKDKGEQIPAVVLRGADFDGTLVIWIDPGGKAVLLGEGGLLPAARQILDKKAAILAVDVLRTGESSTAPPREVNKQYAAFTFGYNRPLLADRVHDILTAVAYAKGHEKIKRVYLVGFEKAGPWVLLARGLCGDAVDRTAADLDQFRFEKVQTTADEMMLPGALKYGGLGALAALAAPGELLIHNDQGTGTDRWLDAAYKAAGDPAHLERRPEQVTPEKVVEWLLR